MNKVRNEAYKWFSLDNYKQLENLTVGEFCRELFNRIELIKKKHDKAFQMLTAFHVPQILEGNVLLHILIPCPIDTLNILDDMEPPLAHTRGLGIQPCSKKEIEDFHQYSQTERTLLFIND